MTIRQYDKMTDEGICPRCGYGVYETLEDGCYDTHWYCEKCGWEGY